MKSNLAILLVFLSASLAKADVLSDARSRFHDGEYEQAAKLFEQSLEKSPPDAAVFFELGRAFNKTGHEAQAALNFRRALILDPQFSAAQAALQETNVALGISAQKPDWRAQLTTHWG